MFEIPNMLLKDGYIQNPILKRFCNDKGLEVFNTKGDLLKTFYKYGDDGHEKECLDWVISTVKEGSKEFCYRKIYNINPAYKNADSLKNVMQQKYPNCPFKTVINYMNTIENTLIDYKIKCDEKQNVEVLSLCFSKMVLEGKERNKEGHISFYPLFVDIYFSSGFIVTRGKAKSTIYEWTDSFLLLKDKHIKTKQYAIEIMNEVIETLQLDVDKNPSVEKSNIYRMLYNLYNKYSFTPDDVKNQMDLVKADTDNFVIELFKKLNLSYGNISNAIQDMDIFVEKFISINGDKEEIFKRDRGAYLIKVISDDIQDLTRVDTSSSQFKPLQCTDAFFDSKKSIIKNKQCDKLHLCFKREKSKYFGSNPYCVQFGVVNNCGYFKTGTYAEERDIEYVLQTVFENFERT